MKKLLFVANRFNPLDRGNSNQTCRSYRSDLGLGQVGCFNPLDRGNSNQTKLLGPNRS